MRDVRLMLELYGDRAGFRPGWGLAVWASGLLVSIVAGAVLSVVSLAAATTPDATQVQLVGWGVIGPEERWLVAIPDEPSGRSGCLITRDAVVRWQDGEPGARIPFASGPIEVDAGEAGVSIRGPAERASCPGGLGDAGALFAQIVREHVRWRQRSWRPPADPRVRHLVPG